MKKDITLVYLLGGISKRFGGGIKSLASVGINKEPLLEISLRQATSSSFTKIIFIVGPTTIEAYQKQFGFNYKGIPITYALQTHDSTKRDKPWGTADALNVAIPFLSTPFVICNGDDLYGQLSFEQSTNFLRQTEENIMIGYELKEVLPNEGKVNRAIIHADSKGIISQVKEVFDITLEKIENSEFQGNSLCSMNIFGLQPRLLSEIQKKVEQFKKENENNRNVECLLPEIMNELIVEKKAKFRVLPAQERWIGITYSSDVEIAKSKLMMSRNLT